MAKNLQISIPTNILAKLEKIKAETGNPMASTIRTALIQYLEKNEE